MADFFQGKNVRVHMTTETTGSYVASSSTPEISTSTGSVAAALVPPLGSTITYAGTTGKLLVETLEFEIAPVREEIDFLGRSYHERPHMRDMWRMTINRREQHPFFSFLYDRADNGISESASGYTTDSWKPATAQRGVTDGYRFHVWLSTNSVLSLQGGTFESYVSKPSVDGIVQETLVFSGNIYKVSSSAYTTSIGSSEL